MNPQEQEFPDTGRFPIINPQICSNNPKFPFRDVRHYTDPCCNYTEKCQIGYAAQKSMEECSKPTHHSSPPKCHSPDLPTSHPWFDGHLHKHHGALESSQPSQPSQQLNKKK